jgi:hypothetical protein
MIVVLCLERRCLELRTEVLTRTEECSLLRAWRLVVVFLIRRRDPGRLEDSLLPVRVLDILDSPGFLPVILIFRFVRILLAIGAFWGSFLVLFPAAMLPTLFRLPVMTVFPGFLVRVIVRAATGSFLFTMVSPVRGVLAVFVRPICGFFGFGGLATTAARLGVDILVRGVFGFGICLRLGCEGVGTDRVLIFFTGWGELILG